MTRLQSNEHESVELSAESRAVYLVACGMLIGFSLGLLMAVIYLGGKS